jgi:tripartite-type tricarboxylate transporter receptor subunit TctC
MIASGQIVALGVAEPVRSRAMANIPTLREAGVANFSATSWLAIFAPHGTPDDRIARLNAEPERDAPDYRSGLCEVGPTDKGAGT